MAKGYEDFLSEEQKREIEKVSTEESNKQYKLKIQKLREKQEKGEELTKDEKLELSANDAVEDAAKDEDEDL